MTARLAHYLRNSTNAITYRLSFNDLTTTTNAGANGLFCEIFGVDNQFVRMRHFQFAKPSLDVAPLQAFLYGVGSSTTASTGTFRISPMNVTNPVAGSTYGGEVRLYTSYVSPTTGTLAATSTGDFLNVDVLSTEVDNEAFGSDDVKFAPTLRGSSESIGLAITSTGGTVINGYVELLVEKP